VKTTQDGLKGELLAARKEAQSSSVQLKAIRNYSEEFYKFFLKDL